LPRLPGHLSVSLAIQDINDVPVKFKDLAKQRRKPWGTGHALLAANPFVRGKAIVITADDDYGAGTYQLLAKELLNDNDQGTAQSVTNWCMVAYPVIDTLSQRGGVN
jgi:UTP-glucose-1-phosphate uridylyltransferase